jgi:GH15 family glucan-1,4-alpha-glucosidase
MRLRRKPPRLADRALANQNWGMSRPIEDYALIGDCQTAALVAKDGSIDWLCFPRFDSGACFAALLGGPEHGRWLISPAGEARCVRRRYRGDTLVLETDLEADGAAVRLIDFMPLRTNLPDLVRIVEGVRGQVRMRTELIIRFDYGSLIPWVRSDDGGITAIAGPDMLRLSSPVETRGEQLETVAEFDVSAGQRLAFDITWYPSHQPRPREIDPFDALKETEDFWSEWSGRCSYDGGWRAEVLRSLITLKALTYSPTGGIVAAPTTSLPEKLGGVRNWDYRFCWLRDATFTLYALLNAGYEEEAAAWREWLLRAAAGQPGQLHIMYGIAGERRLPELELPWLPGYEESAPVRTGNAAHNQLQLDVFGEVLDAMHQSWRAGLQPDAAAWSLERALLDHLESAWCEPDEGIWEVRGKRRHFTHSKVMAWVAMDRAVKAVERFGLDGPAAKWRRLRAQIHDEVCSHGFDGELGSFVQSYGSKHLDASLLMIPLVGFLAPDDPRVRGTVAAIERHLVTDGFAARYQNDPEIDGLPHGEGAFLLCTFWLADNLELQGRHEDAKRIFERLLAVRSDVGLLAESYDVADGRLLGNYPQAFSHVGLVNTAHNLSRRGGPAEHRPKS